MVNDPPPVRDMPKRPPSRVGGRGVSRAPGRLLARYAVLGLTAWREIQLSDEIAATNEAPLVSREHEGTAVTVLGVAYAHNLWAEPHLDTVRIGAASRRLSSGEVIQIHGPEPSGAKSQCRSSS